MAKANSITDCLLPETREKYKALKSYIERLGSVAVALSGGVDSSLLAQICFNMLGNKSLAITVVSPLLAKNELEDASKIASLVGIKHILLKKNDIEANVRSNPVNRCYFCKKADFADIINEAKKHNILNVADGANTDDLSDYRPGTKATHELKIKSPFQVAKLTKNEIRELSRMFKLPTCNKPAFACLASRIPYNHEITKEKLKQTEKAEVFLQAIGLQGVRVRNHDTIARIEVPSEQREIFFSTKTMDLVSKQFKSLGFIYVCLELEGYSMGSLNRRIK